MAKKAKKAVEETPAPKAETKAAKSSGGTRRSRSLWQQGLPFALGAIVMLALLDGGVALQLMKGIRAHQHDLAEQQRAYYLAAVNTRIDNYNQVADALVANPAPLLAALAGGSATIAPQEAQLGQVAAGAVEVRLSPAIIDPTAGLTYAQQAMVTRTTYGKGQPPELGLLHQQIKVVSLSRPLRDATGNVVGALIVSFPLRPLADALTSYDAAGSHVELGQGFGGDKSTIIASAGASTHEGVVPQAMATHDPNWELRYAAAPDLGAQAMPAALIYGLLAAGPVIVSVLFLLALRLLQGRLSQDVDLLDSYNENFLRYGNRERPALRFSHFDNMLYHFDQYVAELRAGKGTAAKSRDEAERDGIAAMDISDSEAELLLGGSMPARTSADSTTVIKAGTARATAAPIKPPASLPAEIFRAYDIRGRASDQLTPDIVRQLGLAIGSEATAKADQVVIVGRDARVSSPQLHKALVDGLQASGRDVIDIGVVPTPVLYFAAQTLSSHSAVMLTGSHNPPEDNGLKIMVAGHTLVAEDIKALRTRIEKQDFTKGSGGYSQQSVSADYIERIASDVVLARPLTVVVDGGNGVAGPIAVRVLEALGCTVVPLFCEPDGKFPNHQPDPSQPDNLTDLQAAVATHQADVGIAFDGDGDRIGIVSPAGEIIYTDRLLMLLAKHVLVSNPGADIIFDVKCSRDLVTVISANGGRPLMCRTGHSYLKAKQAEAHSPLAGEMSGHVILNDRWYAFDDAIYTAARLLEILSMEAQDADAVFAEFPHSVSTPELVVPMQEDMKQSFMAALTRKASFEGGTVNNLDGIRVDFPDGWGLVRASNTTASLVMRFEGRDAAALKRIQQQFKALLQAVEPALALPF